MLIYKLQIHRAIRMSPAVNYFVSPTTLSFKVGNWDDNVPTLNYLTLAESKCLIHASVLWLIIYIKYMYIYILYLVYQLSYKSRCSLAKFPNPAPLQWNSGTSLVAYTSSSHCTLKYATSPTSVFTKMLLGEMWGDGDHRVTAKFQSISHSVSSVSMNFDLAQSHSKQSSNHQAIQR